MKLSLLESRLFGRICYGFRRDKQGLIEIVSDEAEIVRSIFYLYINGNSLEDIQTYLLDRKISSPSGNIKWSRDVLNKLLNNAKYTKGIISFEDYCDVYYLKSDNCRNPNRKEKEFSECQEQQKRNCYGLML